MKVTCPRDRLVDQLAKAERVVGKNPSLPVLSCVLLSAEGRTLRLQATNLDLSFEAELTATVEAPGQVAVPGSVLASYVSGLSFESKLALSLEGGNLRVAGERSDTLIKAVPHEDFPVLPKLAGGETFPVEAADLVAGFRAVFYAAATTAMKPELASVFVHADDGHLTFVATDSFRLAEKKVPARGAEDFQGALVPARNVAEIVRVFEGAREPVEVRHDRSQVSFSVPGTYVSSRTIDGAFPDYRQIIPKSNATEVICLKQDAISALRLSTVFADKFNQVTLLADPKAGVFAVETKSAERGESKTTVPATVRGEAVSLSFNQRYIADCFSSIASDSVRFRFSGIGKAMVIGGVSDPSFTYLVMPINR
ncbi:MAG TPA: DNA polymerase III subunit beta [Candidatus Paceibacterota bacterium]